MKSLLSRLPDVHRPLTKRNQLGHVANDILSARAFSPDALLHAWRKVRANGGGPGADGEDLRKFEAHLQANLTTLRNELLLGKYRPRPVLRVLVPKASGGRRPISILAVRDRVAQRAAHDVLAPLFEPHFLDCSFGFREGRSTRHAVDAVIRHRNAGLRWVVDGDIKQCFEHIDHELLMRFVSGEVQDRLMLSLIDKWLKARVFNDMPTPSAALPQKGEGAEGEVGAMQGSAMSPLLCNVYLHTFDTALTRAGYALVRYADDWLILCKSEADARQALADATRALSNLKLMVNPYRTRLARFDEGFAFLGAFFIRDEQYWIAPTPSPRGRGEAARSRGRLG